MTSRIPSSCPSERASTQAPCQAASTETASSITQPASSGVNRETASGNARPAGSPTTKQSSGSLARRIRDAGQSVRETLASSTASGPCAVTRPGETGRRSPLISSWTLSSCAPSPAMNMFSGPSNPSDVCNTQPRRVASEVSNEPSASATRPATGPA